MHNRKPNPHNEDTLLPSDDYFYHNNVHHAPPASLLKKNSSTQPLSSSLLLESSEENEYHDPLYWFALLLTSPNQKHEFTYGWYQDQLENFNLLGKTQFQNPILTRLGFQDTQVTSKNFFHYFRTFNVKEECTKQHSAQIYPFHTAREYINNEGIDLDAVLHHLEFKRPFSMDPIEKQQGIVDNLHAAISVKESIGSKSSALEHSALIDKVFGEKVWRGMRRLAIFMGSEAVMDQALQQLIQNPGDIESMKRFSHSPADLSVCFQRACSVWTNYLYYNIELAKNGMFGVKPLSKNKGICAFISNCNKGGIAHFRYAILKKLSEYVPIRQYGLCGKNVEEGPGGKSFELANNCRFYYAVENSVTKDYVTEKFFEGIAALQSGAKLLMIYKGAPNIRDFGFPTSTFINIDDFDTIDDLGRYLQHLDSEEAFESRFSEITQQDLFKIDQAIESMGYKLSSNTPCRILKSIGQMKLARYLLFKIGLNPQNHKVNQLEWNEFKQNLASLGRARLEILDRIYFNAYGIFYKEGNYKNMYNLGWYQ